MRKGNGKGKHLEQRIDAAEWADDESEPDTPPSHDPPDWIRDTPEMPAYTHPPYPEQGWHTYEAGMERAEKQQDSHRTGILPSRRIMPHDG